MSKATTLFPYDAMWREAGCAYRGLEDVRGDLKASAAGLAQADLDRDPGSAAPSIAALLCHCGMAEISWITKVWRKQAVPAAWREFYEAGMFRGAKSTPPRGVPVERIFAWLDAIREETRVWIMRNVTDRDLDRQIETPRGTATPRWILHHLIEHEAHHRGQITLLRRLFGKPAAESM